MSARPPFLMPANADVSEPARLETKQVLEDGTFEGYASLFDAEDMGRDVVMRGAFTESLRAKGASGIKMLFQHDPSEPIGVWEEITEDAKGLYVRGRLMTAVTKAREVLSLMRAGALDGLSIGFKAQRTQRDARTGVRRILKLDLWEISVVTFPMLPSARVASVKMPPLVRGSVTTRDFERWLTRDAGLTRSEARALARGGLKELKTLREARLWLDDDPHVAARVRAAARMLKQ
ncbi:MAG: HK97 family phage prohead protease [Hyphomicrobiaceae bacterium]|nr:HK97 family phage prohead protease [Hyphomicrobiaceae bacterium]